jgi:hypothetical protein
METPTSTRELVGNEREDARETRRFDREGDEPAGTAETRRGETTAADTRDADTDTRAESTNTERGGTAAFAADTDRAGDDSPELLPREQNADFQSRWEKIQTGFVDEPRQTVEQADELVAELMKRLAEGFATERERLEGQWGRGEDVSTEDLRVTLQRYRGFFHRLLSA